MLRTPNHILFPGSGSESGNTRKSSIRIRGSDMDPNPAPPKMFEIRGKPIKYVCVCVCVWVWVWVCVCVCVCYMHQKIRLNASLGLFVSVPSVMVLYRILKIIYFFLSFVIQQIFLTICCTQIHSSEILWLSYYFYYERFFLTFCFSILYLCFIFCAEKK